MSYQFPAGYVDENGVLHKEFTIRELTGEDEEEIAKNENRKNGSMIVRTILERCVESIGTIEKSSMPKNKWREVIQKLLIGDQDYALLQIRKESMGDEIAVSNICPRCGEKLNTIIEVDELPILPFSGQREISFELPKGYKDKEGQLHTMGKLRYPDGFDREILDQVARKNLGLANTMLLTRIITEFDGLKVTDDLLRKFSMRDREYLVNLLQENKFGVDLTVEITCTACGEPFTGTSSLENFL